MIPRTAILSAAVACAISLCNGPASADSSFDCEKASTSAELENCARSALDAKIDRLFRTILERYSGKDRVDFLANQNNWLKRRDACPNAWGCGLYPPRLEAL